MRRTLLLALAVLTLGSGLARAKPAPTGWALRRVLTETSPDGSKAIIETTVFADDKGALRTSEPGGLWYQRRWADGHELIGDPSAKTWHELDPAGQTEAREQGQGFLVGYLGLEGNRIRSGVAEATGGSREFAGIACPEVVIRDVPLEGVTTRVFHCEGLVPEPWRERLLRAELGGGDTPPLLPLEVILTLTGYPVLIESDVALGPLRRELHFDLQQLQLARVKPARAALPRGWSRGKSPRAELTESLTELSKAYNRAPLPGSSGLYLAVQKGDVETIRRLQAQGASLEAPGPEGRSALQLAAMKEQLESVKVLAELGADLDAPSGPRSRTALHEAAEVGSVAVIQALLAAGAGPLVQDSDGKTPLHLAAWRHDSAAPVLALLADARVDKDAKDEWNRTPLLLAAARGRAAPARALLEAGADPSIPNKTGNTPLSIARRNGRDALVLLLEGHGAPDVERDLFWAAANGDIETAARLLAAGAEPNTLDASGFSPLGQCLRNARLETVKTLVRGGARLDFPQADGYEVIHLAASWGREDALDLLLSLGADVNSATERGVTPLHLAARKGRLAILQRLLADPAVDRRLTHSSVGRTALHQAARYAQLEAVKVLLAAGLPADVADASGFQPVHAAVSGGSREVVEYLLAQPGVEASAVDKWSRGLLWWAVKDGRAEIIPFLVESGAPLDLRDSGGLSLADLATAEGHPELLPLLQQGD